MQCEAAPPVCQHPQWDLLPFKRIIWMRCMLNVFIVCWKLPIESPSPLDWGDMKAAAGLLLLLPPLLCYGEFLESQNCWRRGQIRLLADNCVIFGLNLISKEIVTCATFFVFEFVGKSEIWELHCVWITDVWGFLLNHYLLPPCFSMYSCILFSPLSNSGS